MGITMAQLDMILIDPERPNSKSLSFRSLISHKETELGHTLALNINRNSYNESSMAL